MKDTIAPTNPFAMQHMRTNLLRERGVLMGIARYPVQVRNHDSVRIQTKNGPYMASRLPVAHFAVIEAPTMAEAVKIVSQTPCAVAHGVVEVWPLEPAQ